MNKPTAIEAAIIVRAKAILEEKHKTLTGSAERNERNAEEDREKASNLRDLIDGLGDSDFVPEGWISPERAEAFKASIRAEVKAEYEKQEALLGNLMSSKNAEIEEAKAEVARINAVQREKLDTMERTYKQAADMIRAQADADVENLRARIKTLDEENHKNVDTLRAEINVLNESNNSLRAEITDCEQECRDLREKTDGFAADFRKIKKILTKNGFVLQVDDSAQVVSLLDAVVRIAAGARDRDEARERAEEPPVCTKCGEPIAKGDDCFTGGDDGLHPNEFQHVRCPGTRPSRLRRVIAAALGAALD